MIRITAVRMSGGTTHEHIAELQWVNPADGDSGKNSRASIVEWLEGDKANVATVGSQSEAVHVGVYRQGARAWLQTYADGKWDNNLLSLPRFS